MEARVHTETWTQRFLAALFATLTVWKQPECPPTGAWTRKLWYVHTMEHYSALERYELSIHAVTWMKLKIITPCKEVRQKMHTVRFHLHNNLENANELMTRMEGWMTKELREALGGDDQHSIVVTVSWACVKTHPMVHFK